MKTEISIAAPSTIFEEVARRQEMVARRAFELFQSHAAFLNLELDDWLNAEREIAAQPDLSLRLVDGRFEIDAALPGVDPKKLEVKVTAEEVLITGERDTPSAVPTNAEQAGKASDGVVRYFASIHLPESIEPDKVKADYKHGLLHLTAPLVKPQVATVPVQG